MTTWAVVATLTAMGLAVVLLVVLEARKAEPTVVYVIYGASWLRPRRVGINVLKDWSRQCFRACRNPACRSRVCRYKHGEDEGAQSWAWAAEVDWSAEPGRWPALRRRHRVLFIPCPSRSVALWVERKLIVHYQCPYNVQLVKPRNRAPKRPRTQEMDRWVS